MSFIRGYLDELLAAIFLLLLVLMAQLRGSPIFETINNSGLTKRTLLGVVVLLVVLFVLKPAARQIKNLGCTLREFAPLIIALAAYEGMKHMHATAITVWLGIEPKDSLMKAADAFLFGKTPYLWFADWGLDKRPFLSIMSLFYSLYYVLPVAALAWFMIKGDMGQFRLIRRGVVVALYGGYCSYVLIPVAGPLTTSTPNSPLFFEKMTQYQFLMDNFRYSFDCFPSLHTAIPWLLVMLCWKKVPGYLMAIALFCAIGITLSTIALRFHYGVDVLAGLAWAGLASALARFSVVQQTSNQHEKVNHTPQMAS